MLRNTAHEKNDAHGKRVGRTFGALALGALTLLASFAQAAQRKVDRTRSIYVPVRFQVCEHMTGVTLAIAGDPQVFTPGERIFMFTYYPDRDALLPEFTEVWIEGEARTDEGVKAIRTNLLVTPERIASSRDSLDRGTDEIERQLRFRRDVRLPETVIDIKCQDSCSRSPKKGAGSTGSESSGAPLASEETFPK